jgi:hypothetical protein
VPPRTESLGTPLQFPLIVDRQLAGAVGANLIDAHLAVIAQLNRGSTGRIQSDP